MSRSKYESLEIYSAILDIFNLMSYTFDDTLSNENIGFYRDKQMERSC